MNVGATEQDMKFLRQTAVCALNALHGHKYHTWDIKACVCIPRPGEAQICTNIALTSYSLPVMALETEGSLDDSPASNKQPIE
jgi:hypothetical protein